MPYVCVDLDNRYVGEHSCGRYHYGDQTMVRDCCVADAKAVKANMLRVALTDQHPAYRLWVAAWSSLTEAECKLVGDTRQVRGVACGFEAIETED